MQTNKQTKTRNETNINEKLIKSKLPIKNNRIEIKQMKKNKQSITEALKLFRLGPPAKEIIRKYRGSVKPVIHDFG